MSGSTVGLPIEGAYEPSPWGPIWPSYDDYQAGTERAIPVVVLEPV